jgi:hypothetical protein
VCALDSKTLINGRRHVRALLPHLPPRQCQPPPQPPGRRRGALHLQAGVPARGRTEVTRQGVDGEAQEAAHRAARHGHDRHMHGHRGWRPHAGDLGYGTTAQSIHTFQLQPNLNMMMVQLLTFGFVLSLLPAAVFSAVSGLELSLSKDQHECKFFNQVVIFLLQVFICPVVECN